MPRPLIIAHRGDQAHALENSVSSVRSALHLPADMVEVDVRKSRDNHLFVMHDERTGRTCDSDVVVESALAAEIAAIRLRNGEMVPTLPDILDAVGGRVGLNIEIKSAGAGALAAAQIVGAGYAGEVVISSFRESEVADARRILPDVPAGQIFDSFSIKDLPGYRAKGYGLISLKRTTVTRELVAACHERKIKVYVWTVDDGDEIRKFSEYEVDGIYSNNPKYALEVVGSINY